MLVFKKQWLWAATVDKIKGATVVGSASSAYKNVVTFLTLVTTDTVSGLTTWYLVAPLRLVQ